MSFFRSSREKTSWVKISWMTSSWKRETRWKTPLRLESQTISQAISISMQSDVDDGRLILTTRVDFYSEKKALAKTKAAWR